MDDSNHATIGSDSELQRSPNVILSFLTVCQADTIPKSNSGRCSSPLLLPKIRKGDVLISEKSYFDTLIFRMFFSHPTFRIGGPMEYLRGLRVERSERNGEKSYKKTNKQKNKKRGNRSYRKHIVCFFFLNHIYL